MNLRIALLSPLLVLGASPSAARDLLPVVNHDFEAKPRKTIKGFEFEGTKAYHPDATGRGQVLELIAPSRIACALTVPAPPKPEALDPDGWFLYYTLDLVGSTEAAIVQLRLLGGAEDTLLAEHSLTVDEPMRVRGVVEASRFAPLVEQSLRVEFDVSKGAVKIDDLCLQRFHEKPTWKLRGKANGRLGPDRLDSGHLGFRALSEHRHTAFSIVEVRPGSPAAEAGLEVGDLVTGLGIEGPLPSSSIAPGLDWFETSHEARLGRTIDGALQAGERAIPIELWRDGEFRTIAVKLREQATLPARFPLSGRLYEDLVRWTVAHQRDNGTWPGSPAVNTALGGLALLGTRDPAHAERIRRTVDHLLEAQKNPSQMKGLAYWYQSYTGMFLCEYFLASGDERVLPWIRETIEWLPSSTHESKWGMQAFGHGPDGLPYDNKALMACTAHLLVFEALAERCGIESKIWEHIRPYVEHSWSNPDEPKGHGGMGYNGSYKDKAEFWSRSGLTALAEHLRGDEPWMRHKLSAFMAERHTYQLNSHAYGEPGGAWGLVALAVVDRAAFDRIFPSYRWRFANAWEPGFGLRYSEPHMGAPYMAEESVLNLAYLMLASVEHGGLVLAGAEPKRWL